MPHQESVLCGQEGKSVPGSMSFSPLQMPNHSFHQPTQVLPLCKSQQPCQCIALMLCTEITLSDERPAGIPFRKAHLKAACSVPPLRASTLGRRIRFPTCWSGWAPKTVSTGYLPAGRVTPSPTLSRAGSAGEAKLVRTASPYSVLLNMLHCHDLWLAVGQPFPRLEDPTQ